MTEITSRLSSILAHLERTLKLYLTYKHLVKNQWRRYRELKEKQHKQLRFMINFAYESVPYYRRLFNSLGLKPEDISKVEDLEKLPMITKETIKHNWEDFKPVNLSSLKYYERSTGGSTGTPLKYRLSEFDDLLSQALRYRGWGHGGYELGDKVAVLGGASLGVMRARNQSSVIRRIFQRSLVKTKKLSSFDMGEKEMQQYAKVINSFKPKFMYGYASSIYFFAKWIDENDVEIHRPLALFTTSEKLYPNMREKIEDVFDCKVFDWYGLNDGGVTACECSEHSGLHIHTERSVMEVVDKHANQLDNGKGKILATSLHNFAMPFIRYDTGDVGYITDDVCGCGREYRLLKEVVGRSVDFLITPEGKNVHGWFFLYIFWEYCKGIREYQVIQEKLDKIVIRIVPEEDFDEKQLDKIREIVEARSQGWQLEFRFVDKIERTGVGKYKFIINNMSKKP